MNAPIPPSNLMSQPTPYSIEASCDLSEDYFLTDDVLIGDGDKVIPFLNTQNDMAEAVVLTHDSHGQPLLAHLHRDPSAVSGWSFTVIDTPFGGITDAAVSSSSTHNAMIMAVGPKNPNGLLPACQLSLLKDGTWTCGSNGWVPALAGPLGVGATAAGDLYWYGWTQQANSKTRNWDYTFWRWDGMGARAGVGGGIVVMVLSFALSSETSPVSAQLMLDATIGGSTASCAVVMLNDINSPKDGGYFINAYRLTDGNPDPTEVGTGNGGAASLLWSYVSAANTSGAPAQLWQGTNGTISFIDETGAQTSIYDGGSVGDGQVAVWQLDDLYTFTILDPQSQVASVVTQIGNPVTGFTLPIPLAGGIDRIYSLPTDPAQGTLFAVDTLGTLNVLAKDPTLGWTQTQVHQDGASLQPVTSWRVQISVLDANRAGVAAGQIQLSTDRPAGCWQASGSTILTPAAPVTLAADSGGKITVSIPAEELDTAVLTAQALDSTGQPSGPPLVITPNIDVQNFLAGQGSLTGKGTLTGTGSQPGQALLNAQNTSWDSKTQAYVSSGPLLPKLSSAGAGPVAQAINHVASLGLGYQPSSGTDVQSVSFDLTPGVTPAFQSSTNPNAFSSLSGTLGDSDWWDSAKNDAESAFHGLRHGVITFKHMVSSWDKDAEHWVVNLTVDIGDGIDNLLTYVISDLKTAIHAISSFFQALGADLKSVWEWLKHFVLGVIRDADINAKVLQGWFGSLSTAGIQILDNLEARTDTFFQDQEAKVAAQIQTWMGDVETMLFGQVAPTPAPAAGTGGDDSNLAFTAAEDFFKFMGHSPAGWLWHKIMSHIQPMSSDSLHVDPSFSQNLPTDLNNILKAAVTTTTDLGTTLSDGLKTFITADGVKQANIGQLFSDVTKLTDDALVLLDKVADTVLDLIKDFLASLDDLLTSEFELPVIGEILEFAGINDFTPSISRVISLIVAYPATLLHNLWVGEGPMFDFDDDSQTRSAPGLLGRGAADKNGFGLDLAAGVVQFIWAGVDLAIDMLALPGKSESSFVVAGDALNVIDFVLPAFMTILQWPTPWNATKTPIPCSNWDFSDAELWGEHNNFIPGIIITTIAPWWAQGATFIWFKVAPEADGGGTEFFNDIVTPFLQYMAAGANIVLGTWWQYDNSHASKTDQANAILDWVIPNLSYYDSPLGIEELADETEGATSLVKLVIDLVANYGATAFCFQQAVAAKSG